MKDLTKKFIFVLCLITLLIGMATIWKDSISNITKHLPKAQAEETQTVNPAGCGLTTVCSGGYCVLTWCIGGCIFVTNGRGGIVQAQKTSGNYIECGCK